MSMLGLKTLPVNHRLHRVYRILGALAGLLLVAFGVAGFLVSGDVLRAPAGNAFCGVCVVAGIVMVLAALTGGNAGAEVNAYGGALLVLLGMACMLTMHSDSTNFLGASMADVIILFVAGMVALAAGLYGRVGQPVH